MRHLIYLDFNAFLVDPEIVFLGERELARINKAGMLLAEGNMITFYDDDKNESGELEYICDDGVLGFDKENAKWFARFGIDSEYYLKPNKDIVTYV